MLIAVDHVLCECMITVGDGLLDVSEPRTCQAAEGMLRA
jgi:hypothetical protein